MHLSRNRIERKQIQRILIDLPTFYNVYKLLTFFQTQRHNLQRDNESKSQYKPKDKSLLNARQKKESDLASGSKTTKSREMIKRGENGIQIVTNRVKPRAVIMSDA